MRRGETAKYVQLLGNMGDLYRAFELFSGKASLTVRPQIYPTWDHAYLTLPIVQRLT